MATSISLDDLVALNDEIASLVRSGVPLELGLSSWGGDLSGPLRQTVGRLGESVERGRRLDEALADPELKIPPVYRAVVTAGLRSGRLPAALESLASSAARVQQLRGTVALALVYPLILLTLAYALMLLLLTVVLPAFVTVYEGHPPAYLVWLAQLGTYLAAGIPIPGTRLAIPWAVLPPMALWIAAIGWWLQSRQSLIVGSDRLWRWIPLAGRAVRRARAASLAEIFALLLEHNVPLPDSVRLAGECTGDKVLARESAALSRQLEQGQTPTVEQLRIVGLPPVLALLMSGGARQSTLVAMARGAADNERRHVERDVTWLRDWLPVWIVVTLGTAIGIVYCLTFFVPFSHLMQALGEPTVNSLRIRP